MPLGYCMECQTLRSIRPGNPRWGDRAVDWYPVPHDVPRVDGDVEGKFGTIPCPGDRRAIR